MEQKMIEVITLNCEQCNQIWEHYHQKEWPNCPNCKRPIFRVKAYKTLVNDNDEILEKGEKKIEKNKQKSSILDKIFNKKSKNEKTLTIRS